MVCEKKYSPKEILVFEAFTRLIDEGISLSSIKVADIAKAAGIGKGTVYEYFENKEEVIAKSILYKMQKDFTTILVICNSEDGFKNKCISGFEEILKVMASSFSYFQILITNNEIHNVFKCINGGKDEVIEFRDYILEILDPIIDLGIDEGIINTNYDRVYIRSVFISVCSGISTIVRFKFGKLTEEEINRQKDFAYLMLTKSLS